MIVNVWHYDARRMYISTYVRTYVTYVCKDKHAPEKGPWVLIELGLLALDLRCRHGLPNSTKRETEQLRLGVMNTTLRCSTHATAYQPTSCNAFIPAPWWLCSR